MIARELERDLLVQRQVDADPRLELRQQRGVAELVDHLHERVLDGDRPVPVDDEAHLEAGGNATGQPGAALGAEAAEGGPAPFVASAVPI